jgi:alpha-1,4-galacturonosyltransferase
MVVRNLVLVLLFVTVIAPIVLYTDRLGTFKTTSSREEFVEDVTTVSLNGHNERLNLLPQESATTVKEPIRIVYSDNSTKSLPNSAALDLQASTHIALSTQGTSFYPFFFTKLLLFFLSIQVGGSNTGC